MRRRPPTAAAPCALCGAPTTHAVHGQAAASGGPVRLYRVFVCRACYADPTDSQRDALLAAIEEQVVVIH